MNPRRLPRWGATILGWTWAFGVWAQSPDTGATPPAPAPAGAAATQAAAIPQDRAGILKSVQGEVTMLHADGRMRTASPGDTVSVVERIHTGENSGASLLLRDGTTLVLGPKTQLDLKEYHFNATTQDGGILVSLLRGSLRMISGLIGRKQPDAVRVDTQTVTIGIRGTDFIVTQP